jgi:cephalosporin-C deacetylase-like acetyl esterase
MGDFFQGGHVIVAAAHDPSITAIVSQVPFVDSLATLKNIGLVQTVRSLLPALRDLLRLLTLRSPYYIPVVGEPGTLACMNTPDAKPGYFSIIPEGSSWKNECPARILFTIALYQPTTVAKRVRCPALVVMAEKDSLCPPQSVEKAASRIEKATLVRMPLGHFDVYTGERFEEAVEVESRFLREHLIGAR